MTEEPPAPEVKGYRVSRNPDGGKQAITIRVAYYDVDGEKQNRDVKLYAKRVASEGETHVAESPTNVTNYGSRFAPDEALPPVFAAENFVEENIEWVKDVVTFAERIQEKSERAKTRMED
jgi:hypothetical protein